MEPQSKYIAITQEIMTKSLQIVQIYKPDVPQIALSIFDFLRVHLEAPEDNQHSLSMTTSKHISQTENQQMNDRRKEITKSKTLASSIEFFNLDNPIALSAGFSGDEFPFTASALEEFIPIAASFCIFKTDQFSSTLQVQPRSRQTLL